MLKNLITLAFGVAVLILFVALIVFALDTSNDGGSRAVAAAFAVAVMVYEVRDQQTRNHAELKTRLDILEKQVNVAREYSSHAAAEVQQLRHRM